MSATAMVLSGARIIVTGAAGFLGSSLLARLAATDCEVVRVMRSGSAPAPAPAGRMRCTDVVGDIADRACWDSLLAGADLVFHLAAQTSVYTADANPLADWHSNVLPMLMLLEACRAQPRKPLIVFPGSCTQFGLCDRLPVDETHPDRPVTVYDQHKLAAEAYLEHYVRNGWARGLTLRLTNVYGPGPLSANPDRGILNRMMRRALNGEPLTLYGVGKALRDYLFVTDTLDAFLAAALHPEAVNGRRFVLASGEGHTLAQAFALVAERAARLTGRPVPVENLPVPAGLSPIEDRDFVGDSRRLQAATGWRPRTLLAAGIELSLQALAGVPGA